ncbi:hypothetical protein NL676_013425 [Syzygium grande]|nr:hypothetical protein NL676_013425 [Syzygium grande]
MEQPCDDSGVPLSYQPEKLEPDSHKLENSDEENDSPIEEVRLTVSIKDDLTLPYLTFRTWFLGITAGAVLSFFKSIAVLPLGKFMAAVLPKKAVCIPGTKWSFSLNSGPFNLKEHVLITIFANAGSSGVYAINIVTIVMAFYHRHIHPLAAMLLTLTTQLYSLILGYGWAGIFRKFLVDSPYMWWPANPIQVSLFRALHEEEVRPKRALTRLQFFLVVLVSSFAYYVVPNYLFPSIAALSFVCWIWKDSVTVQIIGSGFSGLGIGFFALDWVTVAAFNGSPLAYPGFAIINIIVGFFLTVYVGSPLSHRTFFYWNGREYNVRLVLNETNFEFNQQGYDAYSKVHLSIFFAFVYGLSFATLAATLSHVALFHGRIIWQQTKATFRDKFDDVHTRLMKKNYDAVPQWWFYSLSLIMIGLAMVACEGFGGQLQLPFWGVMLAIGIVLFFMLPIGVITATTNQQPGLNVISELIIGYLYPGRPLANVVFKTYGYVSLVQAITFLSDFKLGHYMKIPPKSMFIVQLV